MEKKVVHKIKEIIPDSIACEMGIESGDVLVSINGQELEDIFDYQYLMEDTYIEVLIKKQDGQEWLLEVDKDEDEDLGVVFENGLMDDYKSCHNKCIFCFIDQMPPGMRETLYFKDDDSRLSFLQGNYVTLTNMSDKDIKRICNYRLEPINISFQTTNPELRCMMLNNRFAGDALKKVDILFEAGIRMNGQIVLCRNVNDRNELERSISDLTKYIPCLESVSVVPVGLSRYRDGLYPLEAFDKESACETIDIIEKWQKRLYEEYGIHFIHASDEWYLLAERELPQADRYDGYLQYENGVGMLRLLIDEFDEALADVFEQYDEAARERVVRNITIATGMLAKPVISDMSRRLMDYFPNLSICVKGIRNDFFGEMITVSGLLTGQDIIAQLKDEKLGDVLVLPENVLRSGEQVLLDDLTVSDLEQTLQVSVDIVKSSGLAFVEKLTGLEIRESQVDYE